MEKPKKVIFTDGTSISFKEVCILFGADLAWMDSVKYRLPLDKWIEKKSVDN